MTLRESSPDMTSATTSVSAVPVPRLCKKYTRSERACLCSSGYALKCIVPRLFENYTRCEWACLHSSGYVLEYTIPRLCQKYTCSEWASLYASGYPLKCIAPLFPIGTRNLHSSQKSFVCETVFLQYLHTMLSSHGISLTGKCPQTTCLTFPQNERQQPLHMLHHFDCLDCVGLHITNNVVFLYMRKRFYHYLIPTSSHTTFVYKHLP